MPSLAELEELELVEVGVSELLIGSEVVSSGVEVLVGSLIELSLLELAGAHPTNSASAEAAIPIILFFIDDSLQNGHSAYVQENRANMRWPHRL